MGVYVIKHPPVVCSALTLPTNHFPITKLSHIHKQSQEHVRNSGSHNPNNKNMDVPIWDLTKIPIIDKTRLMPITDPIHWVQFQIVYLLIKTASMKNGHTAQITRCKFPVFSDLKAISNRRSLLWHFQNHERTSDETECIAVKLDEHVQRLVWVCVDHYWLQWQQNIQYQYK